MHCAEYTLSPADSGHPYILCGKRYTPFASSSVSSAHDAHADDRHALTVVFLHSTSFHKETWEPTLESILSILDDPTSSSASSSHTRHAAPRIREAWSIDCPNHGQAGYLNSRSGLLRSHPFARDYPCKHYAEAALAFLLAPRIHAHLRGRPIVLVGHSLGGVAATLLAARVRGLDGEGYGHQGRLTIVGTILVDPMLSSLGRAPLEPLREKLLKASQTRQDRWPSREKARRGFARRWHPRIADLFVQHALVPSPSHSASPLTTAEAEAEEQQQSFTLACSRAEEEAMYRDARGPVEPVPFLAPLTRSMPVHLVLGAKKDCIPGAVHDALAYGDLGRRWRSVRNVEGVGHLVPQIDPEGCARAIVGALQMDVGLVVNVVGGGVEDGHEEEEREEMRRRVAPLRNRRPPFVEQQRYAFAAMPRGKL